MGSGFCFMAIYKGVPRVLQVVSGWGRALHWTHGAGSKT